MFTQKTLTYLLLLLPLFVQAQPAPEVTFKKKRFHLTFQQVNNLILVDLTINAIAIDKVRPHSPASRAGIQEGDELLRINGRNVVYMNLAEINRLLQLRPGQRIRLLVSRNGQRLQKEFYLEELFK